MPVKILLPTLYDTRGGSTRVLLAAADALRGCHAVTVRAPLPEADERTPPRFPSRPLAGPWRKLAVLPRLAGLVAAEAKALRRLRPDLIHVHDEPTLYVYGLAARLLRPRPFVLWHLHAPAAGGRAGALRASLADACIVISPHATPPTRLPWRLVRNPLPALPPHARPDGDTRLAGLAVVGALGPRKGQDRAVEALAVLLRMPEAAQAHLTLIGPELDAAFAAALRMRVTALGLDGRVTFAGERPPETAFAGVTLALFPSRAEMQPLALAEAMARGLPVVASDIPAHRAMLEDAGADLTSLGDPAAAPLAAAILRAAACPVRPGLAERIRALYAPERFRADLTAAVDALTAGRIRATDL